MCVCVTLVSSLPQLRTDAEKRSLVESGLAWYSEDAKVGRKLDVGGAYDTGSLKAEPTRRWKKSRPLEGAGPEKAGKDVKKPQSLGQPGSFRRGRNPPIGVTSPITHTSQSVLKVAGKNTSQMSQILSIRRKV